MTIQASGGNDSVRNDYGDYVTIDGGAGDDTIRTYGTRYQSTSSVSGYYTYNAINNYINGGDGNDYIYNSGRYSTLVGGNGNDTIFNDYNSAGDGVKIYAGSGNDSIYNNSSSVTIDSGAGDDWITSSNGEFVSIYAVDGNDTISAVGSNSTVITGSGDNYIGISGAYVYVDSDAGNDFVNILYSYESINTGAGNDTVNNYQGKYSIINAGAGNDSIRNYKGEYVTIDAGAGNDTIVNEGYVYRGSYDSSLGTYYTRYDGLSGYVNGGGGNDYIQNSIIYSTISGGDGNDTIENFTAVNSYASMSGYYAHYSTISGDAGNDVISLGSSEDNLIVYKSGDGNDTIYGYDADDTLKISGGTYSTVASGSDVIVKVGSGSMLLKGAKNISLNIDGESGGDEDSLPAGISIKGVVLKASKKFTGNKIDVADYSGVTKVNAAAVTKNISIVGSSAANSLKGGKGADTISGGNGNDTLTGGNGKDVFVYSGGNDFITDYKAGEDKIKLSGASITGASLSSSNVVLKTTSGNITVKSAKNKKITVIDKNGNETSQIYPVAETMPAGLSYDTSRKKLTVSKTYKGSAIDLADYASSVKTVDASKFTKKIQITGNNLGDTILGGTKADKLTGGSKADSISGGAGKDTISGGKGNDTLTGDAGKDVFVYGSGDGKDVITDYKSGEDKIKISSGSISKTTYSGNNVVFKIGSGTLTVKDGKGKKIKITDANNKTTNQTYSGAVSGSSKLFADDNFISDDTNLDAITEPKISVTQIQTEEKSVAQDETLITYAEK